MSKNSENFVRNFRISKKGPRALKHWIHVEKLFLDQFRRNNERLKIQKILVKIF